MFHLAHDFTSCAATYAKIIISELALPVSQKTIKPAKKYGGIAGGTKVFLYIILWLLIFMFSVSGGSQDNSFSGSRRIDFVQVRFGF